MVLTWSNHFNGPLAFTAYSWNGKLIAKAIQ